MRAALLMLSILASVSPLAAIADNPLAEAYTRGLIDRPPTTRKLSPQQLQREQQRAVEKSEKIMQRAQSRPGLLGQYLTMRASYDADDDRVFRMIFGQYLSWFQTWIGDYDGAHKSFSPAQHQSSDDAPSPIADGFRAQPAGEAILRLAQDRKAVFFNEAHNAPVTRTLTLQLLAALRAQGYGYFAAETLSTAKDDWSALGYPTAASGFYANEPIYGEMIRAALHLGYKVVAYDADEGDVGAREEAGARALAAIVQRDPNARIVVNAGFSHIQKSGDYLGSSSMAERFRKISGVEPLSIEQTMMIEHATTAQDHPYYRAAIDKEHIDAPFVFVDAAGKTWTLKPARYDVSVFFPPQKLRDGRPEWPSLGGARRAVEVDSADCKKKLPCLIEAKYANEGDDAVAADRVMLDTGSERSVLYVFPGTYRVRALDRDGNVIATRTIGGDSSR